MGDLRARDLPAYAQAALAHYRRLLDYLEAVAPALGTRIVARFAGADPDAILASYLDSDCEQPLLLALEAEIRAILADGRLKALSRAAAKPGTGSVFKRLARGLGFRKPPPPRPDLKDLLVSLSTEEKAAALEAALLRVLRESGGAERVADFVRAAAFSTSNVTRARNLVDTVCEAGAVPLLRLAEPLLAGRDLPGLTPFVLAAGARIAARVGLDGWAVALAHRAVEAAVPDFGELGMAGGEAALRSGRTAEAAALAAAWRRADPEAEGALRLAAAACQPGEEAGAGALLEQALGKARSPEAAALLAAVRTGQGDVAAAERVLRRALVSGGDRGPLLAGLHNLQVARGSEAGSLATLFLGYGTALRWTRFHPDLLVDAGPGMGDAGSSPSVSVVLVASEGGRALVTTMASILDQSHRQLELVIVAARADPATRRLIVAHADRRVRVVEAPDASWGAALDAGLAEASADRIAIAREGDFWLRDLVARHLVARRGSRTIAVTTASALTARADGGAALGRLGVPTEQSSRAMMISRRALKEVGGFQPVGEGAAAEWFGRASLLLDPAAIARIDQILSVAPPAEGNGLAGEREFARSADWREAELTRLVAGDAPPRNSRDPAPAQPHARLPATA